MDVVNANVCREPAQNTRQVITGTAMKRSLVKTPILVMGPGGAFELVWKKEQPHIDRRRQSRDRKMYKEEWPKADQLDHGGNQNRDGGSQGIQPLRIIPIGRL